MFSLGRVGLGKTIREARLAKGWTLEKLEAESGVARGTISALENRDSSRSAYFPRLAEALGVPLADLYSVSEDGVTLLEVKTGDALRAEEARAAYGLTPILAWEHEEDLPPGDFVLVPRLDVHLSAGHGHEQVEIDFAEKTPIAFRADWIREQRLRPKKLAAMKASGDSMEPRIHDGDLLAIDTSQTSIIDGKVYALWYDGGERVKRLYRLPGGGIRIQSDNPRHGTIELGPDYAGHVRIIGRVVHTSGTGGL
jgi:phage repressor protein C with HTH and peptisase S24 domain